MATRPLLTPQTDARICVHDARQLLAGQPTAQIVLDDSIYTLRITKAGKLILTK